MMPGRKDYGYMDVSGNTDERVTAIRTAHPAGALIHSTDGSDSLHWLQGGSAIAGAPASADYLIAKWGKIYKITPPGRYAYHAGRSTFELDGITYEGDRLSQLLIGIELEYLAEEQPTLNQYDALGQLLEKLRLDNAWPLWYPIVGHYAVARPMGRRSDPTNFNWNLLRRYMADEQA